MKLTGNLPSMAGREVSPGIFLVGEPTPIPGTNKLRAIANAFGVLVLVELSLTFHTKSGSQGG